MKLVSHTLHWDWTNYFLFLLLLREMVRYILASRRKILSWYDLYLPIFSLPYLVFTILPRSHLTYVHNTPSHVFPVSQHRYIDAPCHSPSHTVVRLVPMNYT